MMPETSTRTNLWYKSVNNFVLTMQPDSIVKCTFLFVFEKLFVLLYVSGPKQDDSLMTLLLQRNVHYWTLKCLLSRGFSRFGYIKDNIIEVDCSSYCPRSACDCVAAHKQWNTSHLTAHFDATSQRTTKLLLSLTRNCFYWLNRLDIILWLFLNVYCKIGSICIAFI